MWWLALLLYVYAIVGVELFAAPDPAHWGGLARALLTLFQILTLEGPAKPAVDVAQRAGTWAAPRKAVIASQVTAWRMAVDESQLLWRATIAPARSNSGLPEWPQ